MALTCFVFLAGCRKDKPRVFQEPEPVNTPMVNGLPPTKRVDGYLYGIYIQRAGDNRIFFYCRSNFAEPSRNLLASHNHNEEWVSAWSPDVLGNIDVGTVLCNGLAIKKQTQSPILTYHIEDVYVEKGTDSLFWKHNGNYSFSPVEIVSRSFPRTALINDTLPPIKKYSPYTLHLDSIVSNYDSVIVKVGQHATSFNEVKKSAGAGVDSVTFSVGELDELYVHGWLVVSVYAFNYSHCTINNKLYVFEQGWKISQWRPIKQ
jgi:hypothetical protein